MDSVGVIAPPLRLTTPDYFASLRAPLHGGSQTFAKATRVTESLVFDLACEKRANHAAQYVISDNVASGIDAERACYGRSRVMDGGVGLSGF